jgi:ATP-grasp domain
MAERVLITGARAAAALDIARDFLAAGWEVHLADCVKARMARWSRLSVQHHRYPPPRQQGQAFHAAIIALVEQQGIALVVPTCEEIFHLAAPALHAALGDRLFAPDLAMLRTLHDKLLFAQACAAWDIPSPESHAIGTTADLRHYAATSRSWVFKPRFSRFGDRAIVGPDARALAGIDVESGSPWMAQRRIEGEEHCFHAVAHRGTLTGFAAYRSDWRLGGGARYAFEPVAEARHRQLHAIACRLVQEARLHGQLACDVMVDAQGVPWLIECNPRATSGVHLLSGSGDLARAMSADVAIRQMAERSAYLGPAMWLFGLPLALRTRRFGAWRRLLSYGSDVISRPGDRAPIAGALVDAARFWATGWRRGLSTNAATTFDIEWNGEEPCP